MGTINKSGQASITNGKLGTTTNYSLGSTGTTKYSLNKGGALVTTQWLIDSVPWSQTLIPGDTIEHSWQLGKTGTTEYNMGRNGSKTLKYTLDPGGNIEESNGKLSGKSGTASYTLGPGSTSNVKATLGKGSTQSYTVGPGGSSTIEMTVAGVPTTITLGPGDSSTTTITEGADAVMECSSTYDEDTPPEESMDYDVGEDGSTDNSWGSTTWDVWLFQPYHVLSSLDYDPICVVMPRGEYTPGCPGRLPSFIQDNGDYPIGTNCRYILIGSATTGIGGWSITQNAIGTLTFATEQTMGEFTTDTPAVAPEEVVNHYQAAVFGNPGNWQLRVGRGGNIWRPVMGNCDKQLRTNDITPSSVVGLNVGTNVDSAWASDQGYVNIYEESDYYVYAYKVETEEDAYFYIYVGTDGNLDTACPVILPEEIETPTVTHTVQVLRVAVVYFDEGRWHVSQKVLGSIAWPQTTGAAPYVPPPEQFEVKVTAGVEEGDWQVQVAKGRVIAMHSLTISPVYGLSQSLVEFNVEGFAVFPTGSRTEGPSVPTSVWASDGYVTIQKLTPGETEEDPPTGSNAWGVYILRNQAEDGGGSGSYAMLAVIADGSEAYTKSVGFPTTNEGNYRWSCYQRIINVSVEGSPGGSGNLIAEMMPYALENYAAERIKIASITWDGTFSQWKVSQLLIGTLTLPGSVTGGTISWTSDPLPGYPSPTLPGGSAQNNIWWGTWTGYDKVFSGYTTSIVES